MTTGWLTDLLRRADQCEDVQPMEDCRMTTIDAITADRRVRQDRAAGVGAGQNPIQPPAPATIEGLASAASKKALDDLETLFSHNDNIIKLIRERADQLEAANNAKREAYKAVLEQMASHAISSVQSAKLLLDSLNAAETVLVETPAPPGDQVARGNGAAQ